MEDPHVEFPFLVTTPPPVNMTPMSTMPSHPCGFPSQSATSASAFTPVGHTVTIGPLTPRTTRQLKVMKAIDLSDRLQREFMCMGEAEPTCKTVDVLKTALAMLSPVPETTSSNAKKTANETLRELKINQPLGGRHYAAPATLVHPDEFKNPSSFLKLYGDPQCVGQEKRNHTDKSSKGASPKVGVKGNWRCPNCHNINFPRRFNCLKCGNKRSDEDDGPVKLYALHVYYQLLPVYQKLAAAEATEQFNGKGDYSDNPYSKSSHRNNASPSAGRCSTQEPIAETSMPPQVAQEMAQENNRAKPNYYGSRELGSPRAGHTGSSTSSSASKSRGKRNGIGRKRSVEEYPEEYTGGDSSGCNGATGLDGAVELPYPHTATGPDGAVELPYHHTATGPDGSVDVPYAHSIRAMMDLHNNNPGAFSYPLYFPSQMDSLAGMFSPQCMGPMGGIPYGNNYMMGGTRTMRMPDSNLPIGEMPEYPQVASFYPNVGGVCSMLPGYRPMPQ